MSGQLPQHSPGSILSPTFAVITELNTFSSWGYLELLAGILPQLKSSLFENESCKFMITSFRHLDIAMPRSFNYMSQWNPSVGSWLFKLDFSFFDQEIPLMHTFKPNYETGICLEIESLYDKSQCYQLLSLNITFPLHSSYQLVSIKITIILSLSTLKIL